MSTPEIRAIALTQANELIKNESSINYLVDKAKRIEAYIIGTDKPRTILTVNDIKPGMVLRDVVSNSGKTWVYLPYYVPTNLPFLELHGTDFGSWRQLSDLPPLRNLSVVA